MGMSISAAIFIGLPRCKLPKLPDDDELEACSPHLGGCNSSNTIIGFRLVESSAYSASTIEYDQVQVDKLKRRFKMLTGQDAMIWLSPYIS